MRPNFDFSNVRQMAYEEWADSLRTYPWGTPMVSEPKVFTTLRTSTSIFGFELGSTKHEQGPCHGYIVSRDYEDVRHDRVDHYHVLFQISGTATLIQNDEVSELAAGDTVLLDAGRPSLLINSGGIQFDLILPREQMTFHVGLELQGGRRSPAGSRAGRALRQILFYAGEDENCSAWACLNMQRVIYDLVGILFEPNFDQMPVPDTAFTRIRDVIKESHADPGLTPSVVAAEAGMSLRRLQALFASHGLTCTDYIHSIRLEHACFLIRRRELYRTNELLSQISYRCGYQDHNYFVRVFHRRFGKSPSAYAKSYRGKF